MATQTREKEIDFSGTFWGTNRGNEVVCDTKLCPYFNSLAYPPKESKGTQLNTISEIKEHRQPTPTIISSCDAQSYSLSPTITRFDAYSGTCSLP